MDIIRWDGSKLTKRENQLVGFLVSTRLEMHVLMVSHEQWAHGKHIEGAANKVLRDLQSYFPDLNFRMKMAEDVQQESKPDVPQTVVIEPFPTHCPQCKTEYKHIGHPLYPGAIMMSTCACKLVQTPDGNGGVIQTLVPPDAQESP